MKVECPYCSKTTEFSEETACSHCEKSLSKDGLTFVAKPLLSALSAIVLTAGGFWGYERFVDSSERYPLEVEYALVNTCVTGSSFDLNRSQLRAQTKVCLCAVERTTSSVSYSDYREDSSRIDGILEQHADECL